jgi:hypothetical protein
VPAASVRALSGNCCRLPIAATLTAAEVRHQKKIIDGRLKIKIRS